MLRSPWRRMVSWIGVHDRSGTVSVATSIRRPKVPEERARPCGSPYRRRSSRKLVPIPGQATSYTPGSRRGISSAPAASVRAE